MTLRLPESTYKLNLLVHRSGPTPANNHHKNKIPESVLSLVGSQGPCWRAGLSHYMSLSEGREIERQPNRFTITWAQMIVKFRVGPIIKIVQLRYALTFQSVCCRMVISFVVTAAPSSLRSLFSLRSRSCFAGSETKSSQTRQITVTHTIIRKNLQELVTQRLPERTYKLNSLVHRSSAPPANNHRKNKTPELVLSLVRS